VSDAKTSLSNRLCGPIESIESAKNARLPALVLTAFSGTIWALIAMNGLFSPSSYGYWSIVYAVALGCVAWGLYKMRKEAAVVALVIALIGLLSGSSLLKLVVDMILLLVSVAAIRGTLAYSLLNRQAMAEKNG